MGRAFIEAGTPALAEPHLREAIETAPDEKKRDALRLLLATALEKLTRVDEAMEIWRALAKDGRGGALPTEKIGFYEATLRDSRLRKLIVARDADFHAGVRGLMERLGFRLERTLDEDAGRVRALWYQMLDNKEKFVVLALVVRPQGTIGIDDVKKFSDSIKMIGGRAGFFVAPAFTFDAIAYARTHSLTLYDFSIFLNAAPGAQGLA